MTLWTVKVDMQDDGSLHGPGLGIFTDSAGVPAPYVVRLAFHWIKAALA